jgi:hypothetical protein
MNMALLPCFAFATRGTPVRFLDTQKVILPMAASGVVAALAGVIFSRPDSHILIQLLFGAATSGSIYLILAGGIIARAKIYSELRSRIVTLSRGVVDKVKEKANLRSAR